MVRLRLVIFAVGSIGSGSPTGWRTDPIPQLAMGVLHERSHRIPGICPGVFVHACADAANDVQRKDARNGLVVRNTLFVRCRCNLHLSFLRGNALVITATIAMYVFALIILPLLTHPHRTIAITWGGVRYAWNSGAIVVPLVLGGLGIALFFWFELKYAEFPTIPAEVVGNRTTVLTYCAVLVHGVCVRFFFTASLAFRLLGQFC